MNSIVQIPIGELVEKIKTWNPLKEGNSTSFKYIDLSSVDKDKKIINPKMVSTIIAHDAPSRARQLVDINDVLVATVRPNLNGIALVKDKQFSGATASTGYCVLRPIKEKLDPKYLYFWVQSNSFVNSMVKLSSGANYPAVSDKIIKNSKIPLPPLKEQKRIAAILDKADAIRRKRQQAIDLTDQLLRSVFLDMFGDPVTNPKGWEKVSLNSVCNKVTDGTHHSPKPQEKGIPYITAKHLKPNKIDFYSKPTFVSEEAHREIFSRCNPEKHDVLYIKDGATTGIAAINQYEFEFSMLSSLALIKPLKERLLPEYLCDWLNFESVKDRVLRNMSGAAITRLTITKIKDLVIELPPIDAQIEYCQIRAKFMESKKNLNSYSKSSENLFNSLTQQAFKGELSQQNEVA